MERRIEEAIRPSHYNQGSIECIDAMVSAFGRKEVATFCKINAMKYIWRLGHKDDEAQEIGKIKWYLDKYLELKEDDLPNFKYNELGEVVTDDEGNVVMEEQECSCKESPFAVNVKVVRREIETALKKKGLTDRQIDHIFNK